MWLLIALLTLILWLWLDNIVIAAILAIFGVNLYDKGKMLYRIKRTPQDSLTLSSSDSSLNSENQMIYQDQENTPNESVKMIETLQDRVERAKSLAIKLHLNQVDKAGRPYIEHLSFVANQVNTLGEDVVITAWLHDSVEDARINLSQIEEQFGSTVAQAVQALTRITHESYEDYLHRLKANPIARQVKLADLIHNMDLTRLSHVTEEDKKRTEKYQKALLFLIQ